MLFLLLPYDNPQSQQHHYLEDFDHISDEQDSKACEEILKKNLGIFLVKFFNVKWQTGDRPLKNNFH